MTMLPDTLRPSSRDEEASVYREGAVRDTLMESWEWRHPPKRPRPGPVLGHDTNGFKTHETLGLGTHGTFGLGTNSLKQGCCKRDLATHYRKPGNNINAGENSKYIQSTPSNKFKIPASNSQYIRHATSASNTHQTLSRTKSCHSASSSSRGLMWYTLCVAVVLCYLPVLTEAVYPVFYLATQMSGLRLPADTEVGTIVYRLRASDAEKDYPLLFGIRGE